MKSLRFLHIPKTAGSTFTALLHHQYFEENTFSFTGNLTLDIKRFEALSEPVRKKIALFTGHAPILTGIKEADNAVTITFLRDPISRVKSFCQHVSEGKSRYLINNFPPASFNLDRFLESGNGELSNLQTKMLINSSPSFAENLSTTGAIDLALDNLFNKIAYYGIQEYFDESLAIFSSALNWNISEYASLNIRNTHNLIQFEERHIERIATLNAIDLEVYKHAKKRFIGMIAKV